MSNLPRHFRFALDPEIVGERSSDRTRIRRGGLRLDIFRERPFASPPNGRWGLSAQPVAGIMEYRSYRDRLEAEQAACLALMEGR